MKIPSLALLLFCVRIVQSQDFEERCGNCWCIPDSGGTDACPDYGPKGIYDTFTDTMIETFASFTLVTSETTSFSSLVDTDGLSECYPFADSVGPIANYPQSNNPQCTQQTSLGEDTVCAIQYTTIADNPDDCPNRSYALAMYSSRDEAESAGAVVTHGGVCGVCSNLNDLAMRMKFAETFEASTVACTTSYVIGGDFDKLVSCFENPDLFGLTKDCATLWAHYSATNAYQCADKCLDTASVNGPPPECELSECIQCSDSSFQADFDALSGRTLTNSGITQRIARPCADFVRVDHDPCLGNATFDAPDTTPVPPTTSPPPPTDAPTSGGSSASSPLGAWIALAAAAVIVGYGWSWE